MWTTPRTWVNGELVTASQFNTDIRDNQNFIWPFVESDNVRFPTFSAGRFTGSGSMTWTVAVGDWLSESYNIQGNEILYQILLATTTTAGVASNVLNIAFPDELRAAKWSIMAPIFYTDLSIVTVQIPPNSSTILLGRLNGNFSIATDGQWFYITLLGLVNR